MFASNFRNHNQHISISEQLSLELKKSGQDILNQINNLNQKIFDQILIKVTNRLVDGMYGVIPNLQEIVIKSNTENENNADLKDIIKKLSQYCNEMVQEYNSDFSTLKQKFQLFVQNILVAADSLLNLIKKDSLHDFKHELVENLKDMMYTLQRIQFRIEVENYNNKELKNVVASIQKEYFDDITIIESCSLDVLKTVVINIKHTIKHVWQMSYYLNTVASNYNEFEIQNKILEASNLLNVANTDGLLISDKLTDTKHAVTVLTEYCINAWNAVRIIFEFLDIRIENKKKSENLKDIVKEVASYGICINRQTGRSVKNDGLFAV